MCEHTPRYVVIHGNTVVYFPRKLPDAMDWANTFVTNLRKTHEHYCVTRVAVLLGDDATYDAGD